MRKPVVLAMLILGVVLLSVSLVPSEAQAASGKSCWGQATKVFAQMDAEEGEASAIGEHSADQAKPRLGLRNLARALFEANVIADDTMDALGAFVAGALGFSIDECS